MNRSQIILLLIGILVLALAFRLIPGHYNLPSEPDVAYYYSILQQAKGLSLPHISIYDNQPPAEALGLYELILIPHIITGISIETLMKFMAPMFGVILVLLTWLLAKLTFNDDKIALLSAFLVAVLPAALNYQLFFAFRGDSFVGVFCLISLICLVAILKTKSKWKKIMYSIIASVALIASVLIWSGGTFATAIFTIATIGIALYYIFLRKQPSDLLIVLYPIIALALFGIMYITFMHMGFITSSFTSIPIIASPAKPGVSSNLGSPYIQETQPPTPSSILGTYGFLAVLGPAILLPLASALGALLVAGLACLLMLGIYLISSKYIEKKEILKINGLALIIPLFAYLFVTMYLNGGEIRFISLAIVPIAICMAYIINTIINLTEPFKLLVVPFILIIILFSGIIFVASYQPADNINPQFVSAMAWLKNNTPTNSTILAIWPDGSVIEGLANRRVFIDSVMADPQSYQIRTSEWFTTNASLQAFNLSPNYILLRNLIFNQSTGLCIVASSTVSNTIKNINASYCNKLTNATFLKSVNPNFYSLWNSCNSIDCHIENGNSTYFLEYNSNQTKIYLVDSR